MTFLENDVTQKLSKNIYFVLVEGALITTHHRDTLRQKMRIKWMCAHKYMNIL